MFFSVSKRPTIDEIHLLYKEGKATPTEVTKFFLNRSHEVDKDLNAVNTYTEELALDQAKMADDNLQEYKQTFGLNWFEKLIEKYPLFGIPYFTKAIILVEGQTLNAGSLILNNFKAPYSATVTEKIHDAGAILLGIASMDEFATGASGETHAYGPTKNPFDKTRIPGGSSSGPATVVASGQSVFSLGTDTGGSIRQPAAFTNTVGLKPTYGLVSRFGVMPMASSLDQVGPFSNSVKDNILLTAILAGKDPQDQTSLESQALISNLHEVLTKLNNSRKSAKFTQTNKPFKIGIPKEFYIDGIDPIIREGIENLKQKLTKIGHELVDVSLPMAKHALSVYYMIMPVELAANLERYDGVRYALQDKSDDSELFFRQREFFGAEVTRRILLGTYASSAGYYDAYYNLAQKVRKLAKDDFDKAFTEVDLMLTPVTPEFPFKIGQKTDDPLSMYLSDIFTCGINPVRIPGLSVPIGFFETAEKVSLPTNVQILGKELSEDKIYSLALDIERLVTEN